MNARAACARLLHQTSTAEPTLTTRSRGFLRSISAAVFLSALSSAMPSRADEQIIFSTNIAPFFYASNGLPNAANELKRPGAVIELLMLAARQQNVTVDIQALPFKRLHARLGSAPETMAVMWRLPEVESSRLWVAKLLSEQLVVIIRSDSSLDPGSLTSLRTMRIGVVLGGPAEAAVRSLGLTNVETASTPESNARKLAVGRIDAWVAFRSVANATRLQIGKDVDAMRVAAELQNMDLYLTSSLTGDMQKNAHWQDAFMRLRSEKLQQALLRRYNLALSPDTRH